MFSARKIKKQSRELLSNNFILQIGVILTLFTCVTAISLLASSVITLIYGLVPDAVFYVIQTFFICFVAIMTVPLIYGLCVFEYNLIITGKGNIKDLFYAFSSYYTINRSFFLAFALLWRAVICFFPATCIYSEIILYKLSRSMLFFPVNIYGFDITYTFICVLFIILIIIGWAIFSKFFTAIFVSLANENTPVSKCFSLASVYNHGYKKKLVGITLSFVPLIVLSIFTMGIVFILYAAPIMLVTYFNFAKNCYDFRKNQ